MGPKTICARPRTSPGDASGSGSPVSGWPRRPGLSRAATPRVLSARRGPSSAGPCVPGTRRHGPTNRSPWRGPRTRPSAQSWASPPARLGPSSFPRAAKGGRGYLTPAGRRPNALSIVPPEDSSDALEDVRDPVDALDDRLAGRGIRETEVAFTGLTERAPRGHRDVRLGEDPLGEGRARQSDVDSGEHVERATRSIRRESVDLLELPEDDLPPRPEFVDHRLQRSRGTSERRDAGLLCERGRAGDRVFLDLPDLPDHQRRGD